MQNTSVKISFIIGMFVILITTLFQLIIGFYIDLIVLFYSALFGLTVGVITYFSRKFIKLREEKIISDITLDLGEEESLIIEGAAKYHIEPNLYRGKLFLTSSRLIFKTIKPKKTEVLFESSLNNVIDVEVKRSLRLMGMSLEINSVLDCNKFMVDFPASWKGVIDDQIKYSINDNLDGYTKANVLV